LARVLKTVGSSEQALPLLDEARLRFEAIAAVSTREDASRMSSSCFSEQGECLWRLGRLDEAVASYEEGIRRDEELGDYRGIAVGKAQIGSIRTNQRRYQEALAALVEAREQFTQMDEPITVSIIWVQIGTVYMEMNEYEAAEDAYRKSLAIKVRLEDVSGQAIILNQLGNLYNILGRLEEGAAFYQQAVDKSVEQSDIASEGLYRQNLADVLRRVKRFDEARQQIRRAIKCKSEFGHSSKLWLSWAVLAAIETNTGNAAAAEDAKREAIACYLAYRRDGGENHEEEGRLSLEITEYLLSGNNVAAASFLQEIAAHPGLATGPRTFTNALQAIVAGSRDRTLANAPNLDYRMAAEILFLIETLEKGN